MKALAVACAVLLLAGCSTQTASDDKISTVEFKYACAYQAVELCAWSKQPECEQEYMRRICPALERPEGGRIWTATDELCLDDLSRVRAADPDGISRLAYMPASCTMQLAMSIRSKREPIARWLTSK